MPKAQKVTAKMDAGARFTLNIIDYAGMKGADRADLLHRSGHSMEQLNGEEATIDRSFFDAVIEAARAEIDESVRLPLWQRAHEILWEDQPYTFLLRRSRLDFVDKRIANIQRVAAGVNTPGLWRMPNEWYVPAVQQKYHD